MEILEGCVSTLSFNSTWVSVLQNKCVVIYLSYAHSLIKTICIQFAQITQWINTVYFNISALCGLSTALSVHTFHWIHVDMSVWPEPRVEEQHMLQGVCGGSRDLQTGAVVSLNAGRRADFRLSVKRITASAPLLHHLSWSEDSLCRETNKPCLYAQLTAAPWISTWKNWLLMLESSSPGRCRWAAHHLLDIVPYGEQPSSNAWIGLPCNCVLQGWRMAVGHGAGSIQHSYSTLWRLKLL